MVCFRGIHQRANSPWRREQGGGQFVNHTGKPLDIGKGEAKTARINPDEKQFSKTAQSQTPMLMGDL
jgi:hypothetical protein